jgi:hypothetical protein
MIMELHESVRDTYKEMIIKNDIGFRLTLQKYEVVNPKGLFSISMVQESLKLDGSVGDSQTYNFFMTKDELHSLAAGLTV